MDGQWDGGMGRWRDVALGDNRRTGGGSAGCLDWQGVQEIIMRSRQERSTTMKESKSETKDPICGMTVDETTALNAERDGKKFYFCSEHCRQKFMSTPTVAKPEDK
jgi:YHS domain-containing protein